MVETETSLNEQPRNESLRGTCPFCLMTMDVYLDVKGRPYWRCWHCEIRSFATKTALNSLKAEGWIWSDERPLEAIKEWLKLVMKSAGLTMEKRK